MTGLTKDVLEKQMQAQYPGAKISDYTTEKKGKGNVFTYKLDVPTNGTSVGSWCKALIPMRPHH